jgi:hypothetical protein
LDESTELIDKIEEKVTLPENAENIYFHREVLFYSLEGRKMEIFTISSRDGIIDDMEDQVMIILVKNLFSLKIVTVYTLRVKGIVL